MSRATPTIHPATTETIDDAVARAVWAALATFGHLPNATVTHGPFATLIASRSPYATFNNVIDSRLPDDATTDRSIRQILAAFAPHSVPATWWVGPTTRPADLGARLERLGLTPVEPEFGMALDLSDPPNAAERETRDRFAQPGTATSVQVEPVDDAGGLDAWLSVMGAAYGWPDVTKTELFRAIHARDLELTGERRETRHFVVRVDGRAQASSSLFMADGHACVTNIGTVPAARGHGLGSLATLAAIDLARHLGRDVATLTASVAGRGVYRRLGFREGGALDRWIAGPEVVARLGGPANAEAGHGAG